MSKFKPTYAISAKSASEVDILIYGVIGDSYWSDGNPGKKFVTDFMQLENQYDRINVRINSPGGSVDDGLPIFNAIRASKKDVHTYVDGIAYSMGAMIALAGKTVHAAKGSMVLLHTVSGGAVGNAKDLRKAAEMMDVYDETLGQLIADKTGKTLSAVQKEWMNYEDHIMTATKACANKLVDVVEDYATQPIPEGLDNMSYEQVMAYYKPEKEEGPTDLIQTVANKVAKILKFNDKSNENMGVFGPDFPKLNALKGKPAAEISEGDIAAIVAELKEKGFDNVVVISTAHATEANTNATQISNSLIAVNAALGEGNTKENLADAVTALIASAKDWKTKAETYGAQPGQVATKPATATKEGQAVVETGATTQQPVPLANQKTSYDLEDDARQAKLKPMVKL